MIVSLSLLDFCPNFWFRCGVLMAPWVHSLGLLGVPWGSLGFFKFPSGISVPKASRHCEIEWYSVLLPFKKVSVESLISELSGINV